MLVSEYLRAKNKLIREATGIDFDLVPEDQIEECEQMPLFAVSDVSVCPYCRVYWNNTFDNNCKDCPMQKAGNGCITYGRFQPTYRAVKQAIYKECDYKGINEVPGVKSLVEQYNLELRHGQ